MFVKVTINNKDNTSVFTDVVGIQASGGIVQIMEYNNVSIFYSGSAFDTISTLAIPENEIEATCSPDAVAWYREQIKVAADAMKEQLDMDKIAADLIQ